MNRNLKLTRIAFIAALYAVLTIILQPISYGPVQVRVSESLTILPIFFPEAIPGLFLGCMIANIFGGFGIYDIVLGSILTLIAAIFTYKFRRNLFFAFGSPILINGFGVAAYLTFLTDVPYLILAAQILAGEAVAVAGIGSLVYLAMGRTPFARAIERPR